MVAEFLEKNYDEVRQFYYLSLCHTTLILLRYQFFTNYAQLVSSSNYVTKRQSLKLLGEILLDRTNFKVMTKYIESEENLKVMMNLLRDKSKNIQFEAFHVFKVRLLHSPMHFHGRPLIFAMLSYRVRILQIFVANPRKPQHIESILRRNKAKLCTFLQNFQNDKDGADIILGLPRESQLLTLLAFLIGRRAIHRTCRLGAPRDRLQTLRISPFPS
jgi:hypothetical protein